MIRKIVFLFCIIFMGLAVKAQVFSVSGTVVDSLTNQKLAFVNVIVNDDGHLGTTTDIDGSFSINSKHEIHKLTFSYVGYKRKSISVEQLKASRKVLMQSDNIELQEIVFKAGENPAHRIIDSVVKNRKLNNPEMLDSYTYTIYDRMTITLDTTEIPDSLIGSFGRLVRDNDLMVMETVSEQYHQKPDKSKRIIKANKISGLNNPMYYYILDGKQSTNFYDEFITVYKKNYINPINPGSKSRYFFGLESVMPTPTGDSIYIISFKPRRGSTFDALKGVMTITSDKWAIVNVKAEAADKTNTLDVKIQQLYAKFNDSVWFPVQLNTDIIFLRMKADDNSIQFSLGMGDDPNLTNTSLLGIGKSYIYDIKINPEIDRKVFGSTDIDMDENSVMHDESYWREYRHDSLSDRIENTHHFVDTIMEDSGFTLDEALDFTTDLLVKGNIPMGYVNLSLNDILKYNLANGFYLGLGLTTNKKLSERYSLKGYFGYWFGGKHINYGGDFKLRIDKRRDFDFNLSFDHRFQMIGDYGFSNEGFNALNENFYKYFYIKWTSLNTTASAELSTRFAKIMQGFVKFSLSDKEFDFNVYRLSNLEFKLRIAPGERYMRSPKGISTVSLGKPIIWLSYQKGINGLFDSPFNYDRLQFQISGSWLIRYLGKTSITLQGGLVTGDVPFTELFNIFANNDNFGIYCTQSFATMKVNEFICDRFVALFFSHNFGKFFKTKLTSPDFIFETNAGWGDISSEHILDGYQTKSMKDGFFESGLVLDNILDLGTSKIGFGVFYRYGANAFDMIEKNFAYKLKIVIGL